MGKKIITMMWLVWCAFCCMWMQQLPSSLAFQHCSVATTCNARHALSRGIIAHSVAKSKTQLYAKKSKRDKSVETKGFGPKKVKNEVNNDKSTSQSSAASDAEDSNGALAMQKSTNNDDDGKPKSIEELMKKYNISDKESMKTKDKKKSGKKTRDPKEPPAFGEEVLANIPMEVQSRIDSILITATFGSLFAVVACGVGISFGALKVVFPQLNIPPDLDTWLVNTLTPAFTPTFLVFFLFSITLGLFKFAQISSSQTVYRE